MTAKQRLESSVSLAKPDSLISVEKMTICLRLKQNTIFGRRAIFQYLYAAVGCVNAPIRTIYFWMQRSSTRCWQKRYKSPAVLLSLQRHILFLLYYRLFLSADVRLTILLPLRVEYKVILIQQTFQLVGQDLIFSILYTYSYS